MRSYGLFACLFLSTATGCAASVKEGAAYLEFAPSAPARLVASKPLAEADALVARFYDEGPSADLDARVAALIAAHPEQSILHELAAYRAVLAADGHAAFEHFLAAASDTAAAVPELYLWEMYGFASRVSELLEAEALLRVVAAQHPSRGARSYATYLLAREQRLFGRFAEAADATRSLGFFPRYRVIGAFDNDQGKGFSLPYPPEVSHERAASPGVLVPVSWREIAPNAAEGVIALGDYVHPSDPALAYLEVFVDCPSARSAELRISSSAGVRAWVGDRLVASEEKIQQIDLDNVVAKIPLEKGPNRVLLKSSHRLGPWRVGARITLPLGEPMTDLRFSIDGPTAGDPRTVKGAVAEVAPVGVIQSLADGNRKRFLLGRTWARAGHTLLSPSHYQAFLDGAPKNVVASYYAALGDWDLGEAGKALDLWGRGAATPGSPAFLVRRGKFYEGRRLLDRAQRDLAAALAENPGAREAELALSSIFAQKGWPIDRCKVVEAAVARAPDFLSALIELGACKEQSGYVSDGEKAYLRAHALEPGNQTALERLEAISQRRGDLESAARWIGLEREAAPSSTDAALADAEVRRKRGDRRGAASVLEALRAQDPDAPRPYEKLAELAYEDGRRPDAERLYRSALERDPDSAPLAERVDALTSTGPSLGDRLAPSSDEIDKAIRSAEALAPHPGATVARLLDDEVTTVNADGSAKRIVTHVTEVLNTDGRDSLIQARLPVRGRVKVLEAFSVKKNGERQEASSIGTDMVRFRSLDVGSITVVQYVHYAPPPKFLPNQYVAEWWFQSMTAQTEVGRWRLILGKDRDLHTMVRGPIEAKTETIEGSVVKTFTASHVPPLVSEPSMAPFADVAATVAVSTVRSWDDYVKWENALLSDVFSPTQETEELAKKIAKGASTPAEKLERLAGYVAQEIRYQQEYEDTIAGVKPHAASVVIERGYGDCKDKAVLLIRLARVLGIQMRFAILRTTPAGKVLKEVPNQQFNHAIAYVPKQAGFDTPFFVDTTTNGLDLQNLRSDDQGATSLVLDPVTGRWEFVEIPYQPAGFEYVRHRITVELSDTSKARAKDTAELRGQGAQSLRIALRSKEGSKKALQSMSDQLFAGTTLASSKVEHDQDLTRPLGIDLDIDLANAVQDDGQDLLLHAPLPFPLQAKATLATRKLPLELARGVLDVEVTVDPPKDRPLKHLPADIDVTHPCFSMKRRAREEKGKVIVTATYENRCAEIAPADYPAFRAAVQKVVAAGQDNLLFGSKKRK